jgi:hypothetical protein
MKTKNKFSKWCKNTLMLLPVMAMLTFMSCQKDDAFTIISPGGATDGNLVTLNVGVAAGTYTFDFENTSGSSVYAVDEAGSNLYVGPFPGYKDPLGLWFMPTHTSSEGFASGGIAFSHWNDTLMSGYRNQCSIYYIDPTNGNGGHNGSNNFALHYGYKDNIWTTAWDGRTIIRLADSTKTALFTEFYVMNSTYAVRSMEYGDNFAKIFSYADKDWFKLIIDGLDVNGNVVRTMDTVYLADFRRSSSPGILRDWKRVDLTPLGRVTAIRFDMLSSDTIPYGLNTPAYFCFDDLTVVLP